MDENIKDLSLRKDVLTANKPNLITLALSCAHALNFFTPLKKGENLINYTRNIF